MSGPALLFALLAGYVAAVLALGLAARRRAGASPEEYYLAGRTFGPLVLFFALFGTNCTPFVLIGIPGRAYHDGIGQFALNAPIIALGIPLTFWLIGAPARRMALRLGALTPAELFARRFDSRAVGLLLFAVFLVYTLPYMVTSIQGAAVTLVSDATRGAIGESGAAAGLLVVALVYTTLGGMRATAWTNVLQGALFLSFMVAVFFVLAQALGGFTAASQRVAREAPELLVLDRERGLFAPRAFASYGLAISLTVVAFPHMFARLMAAKDDRALRAVSLSYPPALLCLWLPAVAIGVWGALEVPGLAGAESDAIFSRMLELHVPEALRVVGLLAVVAAVMSTLDAQILTLGSMLSRDVLAPRAGGSGGSVAAGRWFGVAVAAAVFALEEWSRRAGLSVFGLARFAFSGYVTLFPALVLGLWWRRASAAGIVLSILAGNAVLLLGETGWMPTFGFLPVLPAFVAAFAVALCASLATCPPRPDLVARAFPGNARG